MSSQPNVDAREICRSKMKLAMAVGIWRPYVVHAMTPGQFEQTAHDCGIPSAVVPLTWCPRTADPRS